MRDGLYTAETADGRRLYTVEEPNAEAARAAIRWHLDRDGWRSRLDAWTADGAILVRRDRMADRGQRY